MHPDECLLLLLWRQLGLLAIHGLGLIQEGTRHGRLKSTAGRGHCWLCKLAVVLLQLQLWRSCLIVLLLLWLLPLLVHLLLWLLPLHLSLLRYLVLLLLVVGLRGMLHSLVLLLWLLISNRLVGLLYDSLLLVCLLLWLLLLHDNHLCRLLHVAVPIGYLPGCLHLLLLRCKLVALHVESWLHLLHLLLLRRAKASRRRRSCRCCCRRLHCCHGT